MTFMTVLAVIGTGLKIAAEILWGIVRGLWGVLVLFVEAVGPLVLKLTERLFVATKAFFGPSPGTPPGAVTTTDIFKSFTLGHVIGISIGVLTTLLTTLQTHLAILMPTNPFGVAAATVILTTLLDLLRRVGQFDTAFFAVSPEIKPVEPTPLPSPVLPVAEVMVEPARPV